MSTNKVVEEYVEAEALLEELNGGPLTFGQMLAALRECEEISQKDMAERLGTTCAKLCDIEKGRRFISVERAVDWARRLSHSEYLFVSLLLEDQVRKSGLSVKVRLEPIKTPSSSPPPSTEAA